MFDMAHLSHTTSKNVWHEAPSKKINHGEDAPCIANVYKYNPICSNIKSTQWHPMEDVTSIKKNITTSKNSAMRMSKHNKQKHHAKHKDLFTGKSSDLFSCMVMNCGQKLMKWWGNTRWSSCVVFFLKKEWIMRILQTEKQTNTNAVSCRCCYITH